MKVVNRVKETDRLPFLKALAHIAAVDDSVTLDEKKMVESYTEAWGLEAEAQQQVQRILEAQQSVSLDALAAEFSETGTRFLLMQELMRLSYADGTYGNAERKEIAAIAQRLGMGERQFREVEKWVGRGQAWEAQDDDADGPGEDQLQDVLGQGDDADDDYDLSDIDTAGDSSLDDIEPGGYELDEDDVEGPEEGNEGASGAEADEDPQS
jgi:uncharacterized tellurite resistance protein B-like protein